MIFVNHFLVTFQLFLTKGLIRLSPTDLQELQETADAKATKLMHQHSTKNVLLEEVVPKANLMFSYIFKLFMLTSGLYLQF